MLWHHKKYQRKSNRHLYVLAATLPLLLILIPAIYFGLRFANRTQAVWMDDSWQYRIKVPVTAHTGAETNKYFSATFDTSDTTRFQSDCGDIRFTDLKGRILQYYIASGCSSASTVIHVLVPDFAINATDYYMYYGNPNAADGFSASDFSAGTGVTIGTLGSEEKTTGPYAYWAFDEGTSTIAHDSASGRYDGTITNGPIWRDSNLCISGKCLFFDGTNDTVTIGNIAALNFEKTDAFSISTWIRTNNPAAANIISKQANIAPFAGWNLQTGGSGKIIFQLANTYSSNTLEVVTTNDMAYSDNKWHHVEVTYDGSNTPAGVNLYFDGVAPAMTTTTNTLSGSIANSSSVEIGSRNAAGNFFKGEIDETKIYKSVRSAAQVRADYNSKGGSRLTGSVQGGVDNVALSSGLVGYWNMDEASWNNNCSSQSVTDLSGNINAVKSCPNTTGPTGGAAGKFGNSGNFDGTNDYLDGGDDTDFEFGSATSEMTLAAWVNPTTITPAAAMTIVSKYNSTSNREYIFQMSTSGKLTLTLSGDGASVTSLSSTSSMTASTWQHVAVTFAASTGTVRFYINGVLDKEGTIAISPIFTGTALFEIGATNKSGTTPDLFWSGNLDEVRVYKKLLSPGTIRSLYAFAPGPLGYWPLDEHAGTSASDLSGNSLTGTVTNGPVWTAGKFGSALTFDGSDDNVNIGNTIDLSGNKPMSLSAWIYPTATPGVNGAGIISKYDRGNAGEWRLFLNSSRQIQMLRECGGFGIVSTTAVTLNTWTHVEGSYDGTNLRIYLNGVLDKTTADSCSVSSTAIEVIIGAGDNGSGVEDVFTGSIDDVRMYSYGRTASQITEDMNGGHPIGGSPVGSQVSYWNMDETNGTTARDTSVNANNLTLSTASWTRSGKTNSAWNGVGTNWLSRADDDDLDFSAAEDFTLSLWFKSDSASNPAATEYLMYKAPSGASNGGYGLYVNTSGQLCFGIDDDNTSFPEDSSCSTADFYDATWHHVLAIKTGTSKIQLFVDTRPQTADVSISSTGTLANTSTFYLGDKDGTDNGDELNGDLDEVKIYRSALTSEQVAIDYNAGASLNYGVTATSESTQITGSAETGPIGYWPMDEKNASTAKDMSGNGRDATLNANFTFDSDSGWTQGKLGSAVHFDGTNDVMQVISTAYNLVGSGDFTIESWVKLDTISSSVNSRILTFQQDASNGYHFAVVSSASGTCGSRFLFEVDKAATYHASGCSSSNPLAVVNTWYHLVGVYNGTTNVATLYVNGIPQVAGSNVTLGLGVAGRLSWASQSTAGTNLMDGVIDETKIFDYGRTQAQVAYDYNRGAPLGYWQLDDCQTSTARDASGNGYNGTLTIGGSGTSVVGTCNTSSSAWGNGSTGKVNSGLGLDGTDDFVDVSDTSNIRFDAATQDFSVFAWVKRGATGAEMDIVSKEDADNDGWRLEFTSSNTVRCSVNSIDVDSTQTITDTTTWHHVGCSVSRAGNGQVYIDGKPSGSATAISSTAMATTAGLRFGARSYTVANYFNGILDDVKLFNYALTLSQVRTIFNGGGGVNFGPSTGQP